MNKTVIAALAGVVFGATLVAVPPLLSERIAMAVSQQLYDCGVRIADGVTQGTMSGFDISGHKYAVCVDSDAPRVTLDHIDMVGPEFSNSAEANAAYERQTGMNSTPGYRQP
jgi:hypothetical protein